MRKVKVKRIKEEPKLRKVIAKRIKPKEILNLDQMRKVRIIRFEKEYQKFIALGKAPDDYVENITNRIALLYMYARHVGMDPDIVKGKLKDIDYTTYMKLYVETEATKLYSLGVYKKMHNGAILLLNLLVLLKIEHDTKIKLPMGLIDFQNAIYRKSFFYKSERADYTIESLRRIFIIKEATIIPLDEDNIEEDLSKIDNIKNCTVMVECSTSRFLSVPMKYFKKLLDIDKFEMSNYLIEDSSSDGITYCHNLKEILKYGYNENESEGDYINSSITHYTDYRTASGIIRILDCLLYYEYFMRSLDDYNGIMNRGTYSSFEEIRITKKDGKIKKYEYSEFIDEFMPFIRL